MFFRLEKKVYTLLSYDQHNKENPVVVQPVLSVAIVGTVVVMKYFQRKRPATVQNMYH